MVKQEAQLSQRDRAALRGISLTRLLPIRYLELLRLLPSARIAYAAAAAAASLMLTAINHVTLKTYWRSYASVVSSVHCYGVWQINSTG